MVSVACKGGAPNTAADAGVDSSPDARPPVACKLTSPPVPPPWLALRGYAVSLGDLDGNSTPDLVVADYSNGRVVIRRGLGDGTFSSTDELDVLVPAPSGVTLADLDRDTNLDLLVSTSPQAGDPAYIYAARGNGDGTFQPRSILFEMAWVGVPLVGDFNEDGRPDLVFRATAIGSNDSVLHVALANANGTYTDSVIDSASLHTVVAVADLDRDGNLDVILTAYAAVLMLPGRGDGTFDPPQSYGTGHLLAVADLDKDGDDDLIQTTSATGGVFVQLNQGNGTFASPLPLDTPAQALDASAGDFDGDGTIDIAVQKSIDRWALCLGKGDGTFAPGIVIPTAQYGTSATADLNGDGLADLFLLGQDASSVHMGDRALPFLVAWRLFGDNWGPPNAIGDVDHDGRIDVATQDRLYLGTGNNSLRMIDVRAGESVALTDTNGDGNLDLVYGVFGTLETKFGHGDGTFEDAVATSTQTPQAANQASWNVITDHDGDGIVDAVLAKELYATKTTPARTYVAFAKGDASGTFTEQLPYTNFGGDCRPLSFWISGALDANKDGRLDLLVHCSASTHIALGNAAGQFTDVSAIPTGAKRIESGDLDGDGIADLALAYDTVQVLFGNGDGSFQPVVVDTRFSDARSIGIADVDGDGKRDLMVGRDNHVTLLINNGDGTFEVGPEYTTHLQTTSLMAADLNGDGRPELLAQMREFLAVLPSPCEQSVSPLTGGAW